MKRLVILPFVCLLLASAGQRKPSAPTYVETLEVTVTNLDVVVTDREGNRVTGLTRDDFEVRENEAPQAITNFAEYAGTSGIAEAVRDTTTTTTAPPPAPPASRKFVFFVDELSLHPNARKALIDNASEFVTREMRDGDEAMVVTTTNAEKLALDFTSAKSAVLAKLAKLLDEQSHFRADTELQREEFLLKHGGDRASNRVYASRVNQRVTSALRTLLGIVGSLGSTPGKKVIIAVTRSMSSQPGHEVWADRPDAAPSLDEFSSRNVFIDAPDNRDWYDARPMIAELAARASANGVTIYTIQPDLGFKLNAPGDAGSSGHAALVAAHLPVITPMQRTVLEDTQATLTTLAGVTGGKYVIGDSRIAGIFRDIAADAASYYSIGYRSPAESNDTIRDIRVAVKGRPDLVVRTRQRVLRYSPQREMDEIVTASLLAPRRVNELGITAETSKLVRHHDSYGIDVVVKIPLENLTFMPIAGGQYEASFSVHYAAADSHDYTTGAFREQTLRVDAADVDAARRKTYTYMSTLLVAPGTAKIAVGVFDRVSHLSGFERLTVDAK